MKFSEVKEVLKKCFGKEKDDRYHAIAMLGIYAFFFLILIIFVRVGGSTTRSEIDDTLNNSNNNDIPIVENNNQDSNINYNNYSYSYTVTYNGKSEVYLGKKFNNKEKFTLIKDNVSNNYTILNNNYFVLNNDTYAKTNIPSNFFKYCDLDMILSFIGNNDSNQYNVTNYDLKNKYKDFLLVDNLKENTISVNKSNGVLKSVDLDFSNYYSCITNNSESLIIHMEFTDIGTTNDFDIKVS